MASYSAISSDELTLDTFKPLDDGRDLCEEALQYPERINALNTLKHTALHLSIIQQRGDIFEKLIENRDVEVNTRDVYKRSPLLECVFLGEHFFATKLLERGANPDVKDSDGLTPLHHAISLNSPYLCQILLEHGASPDVRNGSGETPFHWAVYYANPEILSLMMCHGADPHVLGKPGFTPFGLVMTRGPFCDFHEEFFTYSFDDGVRCEVALTDLAAAMLCNQEVYFRLLAIASRVVCTGSSVFAFANFAKCLSFEDIDLLFEVFPEVKHAICDRLGFCFFDLCIAEMAVNRSRTKLDVVKILTEFLDDETVQDLIESQHHQGPVVHLIASVCYSMQFPQKFMMSAVMRLMVMGVKLREFDMHMIYALYGHCELFAMLLHMKLPAPYWYPRMSNTPVMPTLIYNPRLSLEMCMNFPRSYVFNWKLPYYFAAPKAVERLEETAKQHKEVEKVVEQMPKVKFPSLLQLARDAFREHFVEENRIENGAQFFTKLNQLDISNTYKDIIALKTPIYRSN